MTFVFGTMRYRLDQCGNDFSLASRQLLTPGSERVECSSHDFDDVQCGSVSEEEDEYLLLLGGRASKNINFVPS